MRVGTCGRRVPACAPKGEKGEGTPMERPSGATRLTEGSIWRKIIGFAIPLFLGNLFQQLYNTADSLIVGNFIGSEALAAVSSSGSLIFLLVGLFNGIAMGAGVVIARYFGARDPENLRRAVHSTVFFGVVSGVLLTGLGILLTPMLLRWMGTPEEVLPSSVLYFRVYFGGALAVVLYNVAVGILQAVGDSKHPLYYLMISSCVNVVLDLLFVAVLGMGVGAAAFATTVSQFLSAALAFRRLCREKTEYQVVPGQVRFDGPMLRRILGIGLPSGLQNSIISFANVIVQSSINRFGAAAMAGCGVYFKIEGFGFLPITCFAMAMATFVSQNLGAQCYDRVRKGARFGILCSMTIAEVVGIGVRLLAPWLMAAFNREPAVIQFGVAQAKIETLFWFLLALSHVMAGILRGAGKAKVPMLVMMICWCIIRISYITVTLRLVFDIRVVFWAYPITWTLSSLAFVCYYFRARWLHGERIGEIREA